MENIFLEKQIKLTENQIEKFIKFKNLLLEYNEKFNLTSIKDENQIYIKHFLDSAMGERYIKENKKVIEIGSGGGFPSIPIAILRKDIKITQVEATGKKCEFLKVVKEKLELDNVEVINARAEELAKDEKYREKYDVVIARAVARLNTLLEYCVPFIKVNGKFLAYKGDVEIEQKEAVNAAKILGVSIEQVYNYRLSDDVENRNIIVYKKEKETDKKYPRGQGKERKKPL